MALLPYEEYLAELRKFPVCFKAGIDLYQDIDGSVEVLLEQKPQSDQYYRNRWATPGGTILIRETQSTFWKRHDELLGITQGKNIPGWIFCGVLETPYTQRQHGITQIFGRLWKEKIISPKGVWHPLEEMKHIDIIPSCSIYVDMALTTLLSGGVPQYSEYLGTDESEK